MKRNKQLKTFGFYCVLLLLVLVMLYSGLQILESTVLRPNPGDVDDYVSKTITRNGVDYFPRQDITVVLVMGIDQNGKVADSQSYNNKGAADMVMVLMLDDTKKECTALHLNRDTMMKIPVLGIGGKPAGSIYGQLALSHTYGSGLADSCENTKKAVSDFLYGLEIDYYVSMNMDAIAILNDAVGGVTVNVVHDFSQVDPTIGMGQVKLMGQQAINFVRTRKDVGDQLNLSRIERQEAYIDGFLEAFRAKRKEQPDFMLEAYEDVADYLVTDCSAKTINSLVNRYAEYDIVEVVSPAGRNVMGEEYFEYHVDEKALDELILRLFYAPK